MKYDKDVFAARIRMRRAELGMTQEELSELSGISMPTICIYEGGSDGLRGGFVPGADRLCALAHALRTTPNYLVGWKGPDPEGRR